MMFTHTQVMWAAQECERQLNVKPMGVIHLLRAAKHAEAISGSWGPEAGKPCVADVATIGRMVEPKINEKGFRHTPVVFRGFTEDACHHSLIDSSLTTLFKMVDDIGEEGAITLDEFMKQFLWIHPFADGNGRVASVLYNWLNGTLNSPVALPDYFREVHTQ